MIKLANTFVLRCNSGYRDKVFAIIGVKVYAAGLYVNPSLLNELSPWKGKSKLEVEQDLALFQTIYQCNEPVTIIMAYLDALLYGRGSNTRMNVNLNYFKCSNFREIIANCFSKRCWWQNFLGCFGWSCFSENQSTNCNWSIDSFNFPEHLSRAIS